MNKVRFVNLPPAPSRLLRVEQIRDFEVDGAGYFHHDNDLLIAAQHVIQDASLTSLKHAYARFARAYETAPEDPMRMFVYPYPPESLDPDYMSALNARLNVSAEHISVVIEVATSDTVRDRGSLRRLLEPLLTRNRATVISIKGIDGPEGSAVEVTIEIQTRGRTAGDALRIGEQAEVLIDAAYANGPLTVQTAAALLRSGHHGALLGQAEAQWMDVKGTPYLSEPAGHLHYASDVAAFANAGGGLIALGLKTAMRRGDEIITAADGILLSLFDVRDHRNLLRDWVYPRLLGVRVEALPFDDDPEHGIVLVEVPEQPLASHPFMVRRAHVAGRVRSGYFTIPVRTDDATARWDIAELHTLVVAGRVALGVAASPEMSSVLREAVNATASRSNEGGNG